MMPSLHITKKNRDFDSPRGSTHHRPVRILGTRPDRRRRPVDSRRDGARWEAPALRGADHRLATETAPRRASSLPPPLPLARPPAARGGPSFDPCLPPPAPPHSPRTPLRTRRPGHLATPPALGPTQVLEAPRACRAPLLVRRHVRRAALDSSMPRARCGPGCGQRAKAAELQCRRTEHRWKRLI